MGRRIWRGLALILWGLFASQGLFAIEVVSGPQVEIDPTGTRATLQWQTDVECGTRLRYGLAAENLDLKAGEGVAVNHAVSLAGLKPDTTYHYVVSTAKARLKEGTFSTVPAKGIKPAAPPPVAKSSPAAAPAAPRAPPPTKTTWGYLPSLQDHFDRHGQDFGATDKHDYARMAWEFLEQAKSQGLPAKLDDSDGTIRVYDPKSGAFAAYNRNGTTKTFFKPGNPGYWARQPGRPVKLVAQ